MPRPPFQPLPDTVFDAVILGTDLCSSILSAALSISGSTVLHLDPEKKYGSTWATIPLDDLAPLLETGPDASLSQNGQNGSSERPIKSNQPFPFGGNVLIDVLEERSGIFLDVIPRPIMGAGELVDCLRATNVGHYIDFRPLEAMYIRLEEGVQKVPCTRSDVFQSKFLNVQDKRLLMRFIKSFTESSDANIDATPSDTPPSVPSFDQLTSTLSAPLKAFINNSIIFTNHPSPKPPAEHVQTFHNSIMRYGTPTPFLYPNYGTGELSQAFCRLSAVNGALYVLRRGLTSIQPKPNELHTLTTTEGEKVRARHAFLPPNSLPLAGMQWRIMAIIDSSIMETTSRFMLSIPPNTHSNKSTITIRQLDSAVKVVPPGKYVLYAETVGRGEEEELIHVVREYVNIAGEAVEEERHALDARADGRPRMLWGVSYARPIYEQEDGEGPVFVNAREDEHDADLVLSEAERCYKTVWPGRKMFGELTNKEEEEDVEENGNEQE